MLHSWMDGRMVEEHRRDLLLAASTGASHPNGASMPNGASNPNGASHPNGASMAVPFAQGSAVPADRTAGVGPHLLEVGPPRLRPDGSVPRRPLGRQVGTLLIRAGTRLGGASMRTS